jgi:hypothetical protein
MIAIRIQGIGSVAGSARRDGWRRTAARGVALAAAHRGIELKARFAMTTRSRMR